MCFEWCTPDNEDRTESYTPSRSQNSHSELPRYPNHRKTAVTNGYDDRTLPADHSLDDNKQFRRPIVYQPTTTPYNEDNVYYQPTATRTEYDDERYVRPLQRESQQDEYPRPFSYTNGLPLPPSTRPKPVVDSPVPRSHSEPEYIEPENPPASWFHNPTIEKKRKDTPMDPQKPWRHPAERNDSQRSNPSVRPPEELRSQLPWSYYQPRDAHPVRPKMKPSQETVPEEMPPVPVPDYTLHFGKSDRPSTAWSEKPSASNNRKGY